MMDDVESGWCRCVNARRNLAALFGSEASRLAVLASWPGCRSLGGSCRRGCWALRVLIADDHPLFRAGMRALLEAVADMQVVGMAATGDEVLALAERCQPDVALMDLHMPGEGGLEATRRIVDSHPSTAVLVVTMFDDDYSVFTAMRAGARGYVLKDADEEEVLRAIRAVGHGEAIFSPASRARTIASARSATWSLLKMFEMWLRTVFGLRHKRSAMAALFTP